MLDGLRALMQGLTSLRHQGYAYVWANVAFVVLSLPIITMPAAFSALFRVAHAAQTQPHEADLDLFWQTFKANFWLSLPWGVVNMVFFLMNFGNLVTYFATTDPFMQFLRAVWIGVIPLWLGLLVYTWPFYYEMKEPSIKGAVRNAGVLMLLNPLFTIVILMAILIIGVLSTIFIAAWILLTWGAIAAIANAAVLNRLSSIRQL